MSEILSACFDLTFSGLQQIFDLDGMFAPLFMLLFITFMIWSLLRLFRV